MKTNEELNALKNEVEELKEKLAELNEDELKQVVSGVSLLEEKLLQNPAIEGTDRSGCGNFSKALRYESQDVPDICAYCRFFRNNRCERRMN